MFVDSHCHIDGPEYDADREEVIARARDAGVTMMLNVGTGDPHSGAFERAVTLSENHEDVYSAVGVHPHDAKLFDAAAERRLIDLARQSARVIAWGEIGLDYHYDHSPRDVQREVFRQQLQIARTLNLPAVIHSREADDDTASILREEFSDYAYPGVMHCFGGSLPMAWSAIELGFFISFAGNLTFKKADDLREIARALPVDRLLVETDCPYLTPVPFRGKRNEPARVVETVKCLAELKGIELEEAARATTANFNRLFLEPHARKTGPWPA
ncbi:MAG TPA: TatD family hydrolase [Pyrinomonadaceae bacterium]|jgi:TatD DNase family protein|nr:TatD family hydrolase [Pyrinomonadaceae bacterium]